MSMVRQQLGGDLLNVYGQEATINSCGEEQAYSNSSEEIKRKQERSRKQKVSMKSYRTYIHAY